MEILLVSSGFIFGVLSYHLYNKLMLIREISSKKQDTLNQFNELIRNIRSGNSQFKTRIKNTVLIESSLMDFGKVIVVLNLEKNEISIIKEERCLYHSTEYLDMKKIKEILSTINEYHGHLINDVVEIMGVKVSRKELESNIRHYQESLQKKIKMDTDEKKYVDLNLETLDIDKILDKINESGIQSLTQEEINFLNNFKS